MFGTLWFISEQPLKCSQPFDLLVLTEPYKWVVCIAVLKAFQDSMPYPVHTTLMYKFGNCFRSKQPQLPFTNVVYVHLSYSNWFHIQAWTIKSQVAQVLYGHSEVRTEPSLVSKRCGYSHHLGSSPLRLKCRCQVPLRCHLEVVDISTSMCASAEHLRV